MAARPNTLSAERAVVVGVDLNGLGVLRSLGRAGVRIIALDTELNKPTMTTRFGQKKRIRALSGPEFIADLLALRAQLSCNPVLLLTQESSVATVSAARDQLSDAYHFTMPSSLLMEKLLNKISFQELAERHGYPIPCAVRLFDGTSFEDLRDLRYPCIVKPTSKDTEYGRRFAKAYKVSTAEEVLRLWAAMREVIDDVIVQEWIEGTDSDVYFCLQYRPLGDGPSVSFVGRKTCQWPIQLGGTASCMPAPEVDDELIAMTDGFFAAVGFIGVGSMEYKRDPRNGKFYMVEPTVGRTDYQEEIASLNGVNIPLAIFRGELGLPMPPRVVPIAPRAWRDPFGYARARQAGALDPLQQLSPGIRICDAYRRLDDPMPYIALKCGAARRRLGAVCPIRSGSDRYTAVKALKRIPKNLFARIQLPPMAKAVLRQDERGNCGADPGPARVIELCIAWLGRAQDRSLSQDGGVSRHFSLLNGWATSYPETTGYIIPTMIAHGQETGSDEAITRARRMLDWLVAIQFPDGGFQGGMIHQVPRVPVTFNTGQILMGLAAGAVLDPRYLEPMRKAADWLVATQDADGCWRKHPTPFAAAGEKTYETHVALGLMDAAAVDDNRGYLQAALRQVDWALANQAANGWLAKCCLEEPVHPLTHTLGYALRGVVGAFLSSRQVRYLRAACLTADGLMKALKSDGSLPGRLDAQWGAAADWVCLTGSSQIAHCWLLLHRETGRDDYRRAGLSANAFVRKAVSIDGPEDIRGGVKGSFPVDGGYGTWQYLNWACKFTIDANREELKLARGDTNPNP